MFCSFVKMLGGNHKSLKSDLGIYKWINVSLKKIACRNLEITNEILALVSHSYHLINGVPDMITGFLNIK